MFTALFFDAGLKVHCHVMQFQVCWARTARASSGSSCTARQISRPPSTTWPTSRAASSTGKCSTVLSLVSICVSVLPFAATVDRSVKNVIFCLNLHFNLQCWGISNGFQMRNDSPPHLSRDLDFNLKFRMPKLKLRSEMGLLNTLSGRSTSSSSSSPTASSQTCRRPNRWVSEGSS